MIESAGWQEGQTIRLVSCETGLDRQIMDFDKMEIVGAPGVAEQLSGILGARVVAPQGFVFTNDSGNITGIYAELDENSAPRGWVSYGE